MRVVFAKSSTQITTSSVITLSIHRISKYWCIKFKYYCLYLKTGPQLFDAYQFLRPKLTKKNAGFRTTPGAKLKTKRLGSHCCVRPTQKPRSALFSTYWNVHCQVKGCIWIVKIHTFTIRRFWCQADLLFRIYRIRKDVCKHFTIEMCLESFLVSIEGLLDHYFPV